MTVLYIIAGLLAAVILFVMVAELQTTISLVVDKGGIWLSYNTGLWKARFIGFQVRLMPGHKPRAWMQLPYLLRPIDVDFSQTFRSVREPKWKPLHMPLKGALDIGAKFVLKEFDVKVKIGVADDAAATALLCGGAMAVLQGARAAIVRGRAQPDGFIIIKPEFTKARLSVRFKCILAIKARHIIWEIAKAYTGRQQNGKSSN